VSWSTATEKENDYFEIERSEDNLQFTTIAKVKGNGNSTRINNYQFVDKNAYTMMQSNGVKNIYYRLKQIDYSGKFEYSPIANVTIGKKDEHNGITLYPNPTASWLTVSSIDGLLLRNVFVTDVTGKVIYETYSSEPKLKIDMSSFDPGVYFIKAANLPIQKLLLNK
jgi:hypothetical protein